MLAIRLPDEIDNRLKDLAEKTGRTKSFYAREAILKHLDDLEDIYLAERELELIKAGKSETYSAEEVGKALLKLDKPVAKRIHRFLTERVSQDPKNQGGFLQGNFWRREFIKEFNLSVFII